MKEFKGMRLFMYNASTAGFALLDAIWLTFLVAFLLPPKEMLAEGMFLYISNERFWGIMTVLGAVIIFGRVIDSIADPLVAHWSDRSRAKMGRRRFFMLVGGLPLAICTVLLFFPPVPNISWINGAWLAIILGFYFLFFTIYVCPYLALIPELGHTEKARLKMTTSQGYFSLLGSSLVMIGGPLLIDFFSKTTTMTISYQKTVISLAIFGAVFLYLAVFAVDEKRFTNTKPSEVSFVSSFKSTIANKDFTYYLVAVIALFFLFNIMRSATIHVVITLMRADMVLASTMFTVVFLVAAVCFPLVAVLIKKWGKKLMMILGLALFSFLSVLIAITGLIPVDPVIWGMVVMGLTGFPVAILIVLPNVVVAELCDEDYKKTGERREAMYFGVQGLFQKINLGLSTASLAFMFAAFGKDIANPLGVRLSFVLGSLVALIGIISMIRYQETSDL